MGNKEIVLCPDLVFDVVNVTIDFEHTVTLQTDHVVMMVLLVQIVVCRIIERTLGNETIVKKGVKRTVDGR
jgi:hypothetical protein